MVVVIGMCACRFKSKKLAERKLSNWTIENRFIVDARHRTESESTQTKNLVYAGMMMFASFSRQFFIFFIIFAVPIDVSRHRVHVHIVHDTQQTAHDTHNRTQY